MHNINADDYVSYYIFKKLPIVTLAHLPLSGSEEIIPSIFASDSPAEEKGAGKWYR